MKIVNHPITVPSGNYCWQYFGKYEICSYFDNTGGHNTCNKGFDILVKTPDGVQKPAECLSLSEPPKKVHLPKPSFQILKFNPKEDRISTVSIYGVLPSFNDFLESIKENPQELVPLLDDNRTKFHKILGKMSCRWTGEFRYDCWLVSLNNSELFIWTAKTKGTIYEVAKGDNCDKDEIKYFLIWLNEELKKH